MYSSTYYAQVYRNFKQLEITAYREKVRYYERHERAILQLEFALFFELFLAYADAVFEIAAYRKYSLVAENIIGMTMTHNLQYVGGTDVFKHVLFRKAAAHHNVMEYATAAHILHELIKIYPEDLLLHRFLHKNLYHQLPRYVKTGRALCIVLSLLSAVLICADIVIVRPLWSAFSPSMSILYWGAFGGAVAAVLGVELWHRWQVFRQVNAFVQRAQARKRHKHTSTFLG